MRYELLGVEKHTGAGVYVRTNAILHLKQLQNKQKKDAKSTKIELYKF